MKIRFADDRDIPGLINLLQQVGEVHHQIRPDLFREGAQKYDETALRRLLTDPNRPILVAVTDENVAGYAFCVLQVTEGDSALQDRKTVYIDDLCVDETVRGKGVAEALYRRVCEYAGQLHFDAVTLNVWCGNNRAMRFYEKCGLKPQKIGMEYILEK